MRVGQGVISTRHDHRTVLSRHLILLAEDAADGRLESAAFLLGRRLVQRVLARVGAALRAGSAV